MFMLIITVIVLLLVVYVVAIKNSNFSKIINMTNIDLQNSMIVDVREKSEFAAGHSDKSINIPLSEIQAGRLDDFKNTNKENIVLVCRSGNRAGQAEQILKQNGITKKIQNLGAWQNLDN